MIFVSVRPLLLLLAATLPSASADDGAFIIRWPACSICFEGQTVGDSDSVLAGVATGLVGPSATCAEVDSLAQGGNFSPATCVLLRRQLSDACGCSDGVPVVPPTDPPVMAPTDAPAVPVTDAPTMAPIPGVTSPPVTGTPTMAPVVTVPPTMAPVAAPTDAPVVAPTDGTIASAVKRRCSCTYPLITHGIRFSFCFAAPAPPVVEGVPVSLTLDGITGDLSDEDQAAFQRACEAFLAAQLPEVAGLTCTLAPESRRRLRQMRWLQDATMVTVIVSGATDLSPEELGEEVSAAVNENSDAFVEELTEESATFSDVADLTAVAVVEEPVPPPTTDTGTGGISPGAIVGIVLAVAVVGAGLVYFVTNQQKSGPLGTSRGAPVEPISEIDTIMVNPPPPRNFEPPKPPVAASIAVSVASQGGGSVTGDGSVTGGTSAAGGGSMEGFSLSAAGDTEGNTAARSAEATSVASNTMSSLRQNMVSRTVTVLPGKLGIVVDTTLEGPVVNKVNDDSPLEGILFPGDLIVAVDDIDTRAMSASAIYALMIRTSKKERKLTVLSEDYTDNA